LERQESLAASLGAKLTGPRLLKGIDRFFDGPIRTIPAQPITGPVGWLEIVSFAKTNPNEFVLNTLADGSRRCQFRLKGYQVEISEDDWRLISSGALDRFSQERPFEEDETAEVATLDILEQRTSVLYKKADEVAARARILHHKLGHRKHDIARRRSLTDSTSPASRRTSSSGQLTPGSTQAFDLHADLLQQFLAPQQGYASGGSASAPHGSPHGLAATGRTASSGRMSTAGAAERGVHQGAEPDPGEALRALVTRKTDRLPKGSIITPPCDRCRRLRAECIKHLTACQGCTKKHARCSWKAVTDEEAAAVRQEMGIAQYGDAETEYYQGRGGSAGFAGDFSPSTRSIEFPSRLSSEGEPGVYSPGLMMNRQLGNSTGVLSRDPPRVAQLASMAVMSSESEPPRRSPHLSSR
jgi:hypothetical protein